MNAIKRVRREGAVSRSNPLIAHRPKSPLFWLLTAALFAGSSAPATSAANPAISPASPAVLDADVCVYGATSGGVAASVAAARMGKKVVLISENNHVGGMTSGGLGVTDRGNESTITGLAGEFYDRVGKAYKSATRVYFFEPKVAEKVFWDMLREAKVQVITNNYLSSVTVSNQLLTSLQTEEGTVVRARQFIDTTYEGDLMAAAGVTFTIGREGTNVYGESLAGVQPPTGSYLYDPYVVPENPASGLLPLVQKQGVEQPGHGDNRLQAYNFRLCLTQSASNKFPIAPPLNYKESDYELLNRYIAARLEQDGAVSLGQLIHIQTLIPNSKTDINANGELSTDFVGYNYAYAATNRAGRAIIRQAHEDYIRGFLYHLAISTNVPQNVRSEMQSWGLAKDEFTDTGGWPHQLYVREARRMISDYVTTQADCAGKTTVPDAIALGSYAMDSHGVQRLAVAGNTRWEGSLFGFVGIPYGISYRAIVPRRGQARNLYCTFALSASHVAFASCRMEPVFMMTSQAAGTAAAFAIDDQADAQDVSYGKLNAQLRADGQMVAWECASQYLTNTVTLGQANTCYVRSQGSWATGSNPGGWGNSYWHDGASGKGSKWVEYTPNIPTNGLYDVYLWWVAANNRAPNTPVDIRHASGTTRVLVNQTLNGSSWVKVLRANFNAGTTGSVIIRNDDTASGTYVIANGVQWRPVNFQLQIPPTQKPQVEILSSDAEAALFQTNTGRITVVRKNDLDLKPLYVLFHISGSASNGLHYAWLASGLTLAAGTTSTNLYVIPATIRDFSPTGNEAVFTLQPNPSYDLTDLNTAVVRVHGYPIDTWRFLEFAPNEAYDRDVSSPIADPDHDGIRNIFEYATGTSPKIAEPREAFLPRINNNGAFQASFWRSRKALDVQTQLQYSADLVNWTNAVASGVARVISVENAGERDRITMALTQPAQDVRAGFFRWSASRLY